MPTLRAIKIGFAWCWAVLVLLLGVTLCKYADGRAGWIAGLSGLEASALGPMLRCLGVAAAGVGLLVFMVFVADDLFPKAPAAITGTLKAVVAIVAAGALAWAACLSWLLR
jgi:hypothetical protein